MWSSRIPRISAELLPVLEVAVKASADIVVGHARARVPVDTGKLRDAIHTERTGLGEYAVIAGDDQVFYGHIVEHGGSHTPPQPFLVPALEESRAEARALAIVALKRLT